jgi:hypothetical protein
MAAHTNVEQLLAIIDQAYDRRSWHGTNLRGSIRAVTPEIAAWRPATGRHNIWELVVHGAYWKYTITRRITSERRGSFPLKGSNWFPRPVEPDADAWRADVALLGQAHRAMRAAIAALPLNRLQAPIKSGPSLSWFISGIAAHDLYHAGQIQLIKALYKSRHR